MLCVHYICLKTFFLICKCMLFLMYLYHYHFGLCCINNNVFAWDGWMCVHVCVVCMCVCVGVYTCVWGLDVWKSMVNIMGHSHSPLPCLTEPRANYSGGLSASALPLPRLQMGPAVPSDSPDSGQYAVEEALHPPCCLLAQIIRYLKENRYIPHVFQPLERTVQINSDSDS